MSAFGRMLLHMSTPTKRAYWRPTADTFGMRLLMTRKHLGLDLREAAQKCGVHYATWSTWERGRKPQDFQAEVLKISDALGVDPMWLAFGDQLSERPGTNIAYYSPRPEQPIPAPVPQHQPNGRRQTFPLAAAVPQTDETSGVLRIRPGRLMPYRAATATL